MKKIYVLDTNVILENPDCVTQSFEDNDLVIPLKVVEELDGLKKGHGDTGYCARQALRNIEQVRGEENIQDGVERNEEGAKIRVVPLTTDEIKNIAGEGFQCNNDDIIIFTALKIKNEENDEPVIFVSNDTSARIKASLMDIPSQFYKEGSVPKESINYTGFRNVETPLEFFGSIDEENEKFRGKRMPSKLTLDEVQGYVDVNNVVPNEFLLFSPEENKYTSKKEGKKLKTVYRFNEDKLVKKNLLYKDVYGDIGGKNLEQSVALDLLLDDEVKVCALTGPAGSGKTFCTIASCMTKLLKEKQYEKLILLKPTVSVSDEIGYLPGGVEDKLSHYLGSYMDNFKALRKLEIDATGQVSDEDKVEKLKDKGIIEIESISFLRGRSLSDCLIIVDEVQNLTQTVVKTILTRVGENSKIIILGDPSQIDRPYLSKYNNGLSYAIEKLRGQEFFGHVKFIHGVRSIVSKVSAELL
jgi:PhoH-like ATPase